MNTITIIGSFSALFISVLVLFYHAGRISARVDALESWQHRVRGDMHEISDKLEGLVTVIEKLTTLIEERTERRKFERKATLD